MPRQIVAEWRPIEEFKDPEYRGWDPLTLLGWWSDAAGGYAAGVGNAAIGYKDTHGQWRDQSDHWPWPSRGQPTHYAIVDCRLIPMRLRPPADHVPLDVTIEGKGLDVAVIRDPETGLYSLVLTITAPNRAFAQRWATEIQGEIEACGTATIELNVER